ncbi:hypothetical protein IFM89_006717 [Coptis chinensis]|uniref:Nudix hydrolase 9 n=1 Tax=Coptis chinensis TaxID=261450 RepID=A0A835HAY6_9MAGN|nr:hypothetical protein IFM89_006717 [Coptis chinensis]
MEKPEEMEAAVSRPYSYTLLLKCPVGLSPSQASSLYLVSVDFSPSYDRNPHPDVNLEDSISQTWNRRIEETPSLFNGTKFRYGGYALHNPDGTSQKSQLCLRLGLTDYRTFMGTNLSKEWERFLIHSEDDPIRCQHTSSPLGNGAVVETADSKIIVLKRSDNVGEFPGHFVFPGGHPEPQEIGISAHRYDQDLTDSEQLNRKNDPIFIGISRRELNVRPTAFFFLKCGLESNEIQQLYSNAQDSYESVQLYSVSRSELEKLATKMPGCHQGGWALYELMVEGHVTE